VTPDARAASRHGHGPRLDEQLDQRLSHQNAATNRPPQAARRDALQSRVKLIRRRFNADAPRLGVDIVAEGDVR
jgi:hypothetical protein